MQYTYLIVSAFLSATSMPIIMGIAHRKKLYDGTGGRKIHTGNIPRLGGIGMFWTFLLVVCFFYFFSDIDIRDRLSARLPVLAPLVGAAALMHFLGLADDLWNLPYRFKLAVQIAVAVGVVAVGYRFESFVFVPDALSGATWLSVIVSVGWIVGVTNAVNLIDGLDGLAGGLSFIAAIAYAIFYYLQGGVVSSFISMVFAGVIAGFLFVNFPAPKAKMFMGDSGSLFLGFFLAMLPLLGQSACGTSITGTRLSLSISHISVGIIPAVSVLALPVFDTLRAISRRLNAGVSIGTPDRLHIHHLFWDSGYKPLSILAILYGTALMQAIVFVVASQLPSYIAVLAELISLIFVALLFRFASSLNSRRL
jgi:UDP-GlcNAc:undecaprenyl-phosphate GlcNAc-1-phosphate transferase